MASSDNFDLLVIGCGPAGKKAGAQAAYFGKRVAVIERAEHMGDDGLAIDEFIEQVFNYPTLSELYKYAAYDGLGNLAGYKLREG